MYLSLTGPLTLEEPDWSSNAPVKGHPPSSLPFAERYPLRILIVEDDYISRRVLTIMLERLGYHIDCAENGRECLNSVAKKTYDLILSDINMPEMDGIECTLSLRGAGNKIPIIAVTANTENTQEYCFASGMDGYLTKPVSSIELKTALKETSQKTNWRGPVVKRTRI